MLSQWSAHPPLMLRRNGVIHFLWFMQHVTNIYANNYCVSFWFIDSRRSRFPPQKPTAFVLDEFYQSSFRFQISLLKVNFHFIKLLRPVRLQSTIVNFPMKNSGDPRHWSSQCEILKLIALRLHNFTRSWKIYPTFVSKLLWISTSWKCHLSQ